MELRLLAITAFALLFSASIHARDAGTNSNTKIRGQYRQITFPNEKLGTFTFLVCNGKMVDRQVVLYAAAVACNEINPKNKSFRKFFRKYPQLYRPTGRLDTYDTPGKSYYIQPITYNGQTSGENIANFVLINEQCQFVDAIVLSKEGSQRKGGIRSTRRFVKKCDFKYQNPSIQT
ncbi:hypothetical protein OnM2_009023 [Erysiphe neolycopersici]|uniref:Uncharacterized protein n=1 Tax=Erysiphe neolycopersici TaxID=212602 RepID=A0A420I6Q1_9PEZI|nr:hypothetical protein OnM2_009023 [Erysiphe neolycopersici]